ncbi:MAG: adenylosuccinate lyase [Mycoplasmataceae bacterium]|nr:adenylosuccinate lyase [Mycoplasmataceae bacterium]
MIERYSRKEMADIWTAENKFKTYLQIEILSCEAWSKLKKIPKKDVDLIKRKAKFNVKKIEQLEEITHHDIIAFTRNVSESLGKEKQWVHYGLTSTDVVDTANACLLKQANEIILKDLIAFLEVLKTKALEYKTTPCIGRTHGIHADITSFGLKWALWYDEMSRNIKRFNDASNNVQVGKLSGAVGNFANNEPYVQTYVCKQLKINEANVATQVIQRDVYAEYFTALAFIGTTIEKIATEIRHLQRTEVHEAEEMFSKGQKGSSAMPHKRNPISSENMCGCARVLRGYMHAAFENIPLWHERDISHSSTERIMLPDATILLDYMLNRYTNVLNNLVVYPQQMLNNINLTRGVIFAQRVMNKLINVGMSREQAYDTVQPIAMEAYNNNKDFRDLLVKNHEMLAKLSVKDIDSCFGLDYYFKNVDYIYKKVGLIK